MAEKATVTPTAAYVPGTDRATIEANRVYQDALRKLNESLDLRKNRTFDPMLLAAAQGFLAPTKTGSFMESLGRVAGSVGEAQEKSIAEQQQEAQQRLAVAQSGLELERLRQRERILGGGNLGMSGMPSAGGLPGPATPGAPAGPAMPAGPVSAAGPATPGAPAAGGLPGALPTGGGLPSMRPPPGFEGIQGVQVAPPDPDFITPERYIQAAMLDPKKSAQDILKEAQEIAQKRYHESEVGVRDRATGLFYAYPKGELVEREINGATYKVDSRTAALLDMYRANNDPRYWGLADRVIKGPDRPGAASGAASGAAPGAGDETTAGLRSEGQKQAEEEERKARASKLGTKAAEREASVTQNDRTARQIYGITGRVGNYLGESQNYFGIFQRPGLMSAVGNFVSQGVQTPGGSINFPGLQQAVTQLMPGASQRDLDNIQKAAADLAEMELLFTRIYLQGQGQVTEGERRIVQRIPGGVSNSPEVLRTRLNLLKERSQFDMDVAAAWDVWEKQNPGKSFLRFERSEMYKDLEKKFEERIADMEKRMPAIPSSQRPPQTARPGTNRNLDAARERVNRELQGGPTRQP